MSTHWEDVRAHWEDVNTHREDVSTHSGLSTHWGCEYAETQLEKIPDRHSFAGDQISFGLWALGSPS